jgi:hypothetical protein
MNFVKKEIKVPYIKQDNRKKFNSLIDTLANQICDEGELNYVITKLIHTCMEKEEKKYSILNKYLGVLECVKSEFCRRIIAPYEDIKIEENGDIDS